jgi:hypothetical protein
VDSEPVEPRTDGGASARGLLSTGGESFRGAASGKISDNPPGDVGGA